jgi:alkylhydroperoxidase family enzyme
MHPGNPPEQPEQFVRDRALQQIRLDCAHAEREHVLFRAVERAVIVDVPEGQDPILHVWGGMVPGIGPAAARFAQAVYDHSTLGLREFEAARLRIAQVNGCLFCQDWRTERDGVKVEESFPHAVMHWRTTRDLDERGRLAAEYAERYALDHHGLDDAFWTRMKRHYSDAEIVELTMSIGSWLSFGRLNQVLGLDTACVLPSHLSKRKSASP